MKRLAIVLLLLAGTALGADMFRIAGNTQTLSLSSSAVVATTIFGGNRYARVTCSATCWLTESATNVDTKYATSASAVLAASEIFYLAVPQSHYVVLRGYNGVGQAWVTPVEIALPHR